MRSCFFEIVHTDLGWIAVAGNENSISRVTLPVQSYVLALRNLNLAGYPLPIRDACGFVKETCLKIKRYIGGGGQI